MNKKLRTTKILLLIIFIIVTVGANAQEYLEVKGVKGEAIILTDTKHTIEDFVKEAIDHAKAEALRRAGILENVNSPLWYKTEDDDNLSEFSSSLLYTELRGALVKYEIMNQDRRIDPETDELLIEVTIDATVIIYRTEHDPNFTITIEGVKDEYELEEDLNFSVKSSKSCYLNLFIASKESASILYPKSTEEQLIIEPDITKEFSVGKLHSSLVSSTNHEQNYLLVFVFSKEPLLFSSEVEDKMEGLTTVENIMQQVLNIEPNERLVEYLFIGLKP